MEIITGEREVIKLTKTHKKDKVNYLVCSDIHGERKKFNRLLKVASRIGYTLGKDLVLIVNGDLIDRGTDSYGVVTTIMELQERHPQHVIVTRGNHEEMFIEWLEEKPHFKGYGDSGGKKTVTSFLKSVGKTRKDFDKEEDLIKFLNKTFKKEIKWIKNLPIYVELDNYVIVHAGVDFDRDDWRDTPFRDMVWTRKLSDSKPPKNNSGKTFIVGHTPTRNIREYRVNTSPDIMDAVYTDEENNVIFIDGGASYNGGRLNGIILKDSNQDKPKYQYIEVKE